MRVKLFKISKALFILPLILLCGTTSLAQKTDVVKMLNGDKITGEIKKLEVGILVFKTDDIETLNIKWDKVESVQTKNVYRIELQDGRVYFGSVWPGDISGTLIIRSPVEDTRLFMHYIVKINRIKETFWEILEGYVKLGASFTKASGIGQASFGFSGNYRTKINYIVLTANSVITTQKSDQTSRKQDAFISYRRALENKWFWGTLLGAEENTELGIQLRTSVGGGVGKYFLQTNINWLNGLAGLTFNREWYADSTNATYNIEGLMSGQYLLFIYDHPKVSIQTTLNIHPSITNLGRIRSDFNVDLNWEIILDLYWVLSFYYNFDNKPASTGSHLDYRFETSFKYEL